MYVELCEPNEAYGCIKRTTGQFCWPLHKRKVWNIFFRSISKDPDESKRVHELVHKFLNYSPLNCSGLGQRGIIKKLNDTLKMIEELDIF